MSDRALKWMEDVRKSATFILDKTRGKSLDDYRKDDVLRSAVERHFEIIGEAVKRLIHEEPALASRLPDAPRVIAFRNLLIHGYDLIDSAMVWSVIRESLPVFLQEIEKLIRERS